MTLPESYGLTIDAKTNTGEMLIHCAAKGGSLKSIKYLEESRGFNIRGTDDNGVTVIHHAAYGDESKMIKYLLTRGFSLDDRIIMAQP